MRVTRMSGEDRQEREQLRQARQAKRAARAQQGGPTQAERQQARMKRRAERARETAANARPGAAKPAKPLQRAGGAQAGGAKAGANVRGARPVEKNPEQGMLAYIDTVRIRLGNAERCEYPDRLHANCREGALFPAFLPKFKLDLGAGAKVFTIGAGFARDIEPVLEARGVMVPTTAITIPQSSLSRAENPLNEYTPPTIAQRIAGAFKPSGALKGTVIEAGQLFSDQFLPGKLNESMEKLEARRAEIAAIYARLRDCGAVIITLASAEVWYDAKSKWFFNRPPPGDIVRRRARHIYFAVQDASDVVAALTPPLAALGEIGIKVVLAVSPVAQRATFSAADAVIANETSKSVLRAAVHRLTETFEHVDYFPAYEIARSAGLHAYMDDNVQLSDEFAALLVETFITAYAGA